MMFTFMITGTRPETVKEVVDAIVLGFFKSINTITENNKDNIQIMSFILFLINNPIIQCIIIRIKSQDKNIYSHNKS